MGSPRHGHASGRLVRGGGRCAAGRGDRRVLADQICFEVNLHADAEERTFYPELKKQGRDEDADKLLSEHSEIKKLVKTVEHGDRATRRSRPP